MKYMLMFCDRPHDSEFDDGLVGKYLALQEEAERNGTFVTGAPLQGAGSGARVRVADGETVVTDGPFAGGDGSVVGVLHHRCADPGRGHCVRRTGAGG